MTEAEKKKEIFPENVSKESVLVISYLLSDKISSSKCKKL